MSRELITYGFGLGCGEVRPVAPEANALSN